ncbi:MAG: radical SAM protein [Candidatus Omnitrophica bacterium]|nr:radical SAM protein [Candidatus Omnitrophota bacterium]
MKKCQPGLFFSRLYRKIDHSPISGQIELTYRCGYDCVHCYCKGSEDKARELTAQEWKKILDTIKEEGCLFLTLTGGDPMVREDFLEIYSYARSQGFLVTVFTNGYNFTDEIFGHFVKSPPHSIEITFNGITPETYESITQVPGSFKKVMRTIEKLRELKMPLVLKSNCLRQNKHEIAHVKAFVARLFENVPRGKYRFRYDPMIYPRLNGDKTPLEYRLSFEELEEVRKQDPDIWDEYLRGIRHGMPGLRRGKEFLYFCNSWMEGFFVNPYGKLKFCNYSNKFSTDLRTGSFKEGFYKTIVQALDEKFKTDSQCKDCPLRMICYYCPARAYMETGNEEGPVPYYCELAKMTYERMRPCEDGVV